MTMHFRLANRRNKWRLVNIDYSTILDFTWIDCSNIFAGRASIKPYKEYLQQYKQKFHCNGQIRFGPRKLCASSILSLPHRWWLSSWLCLAASCYVHSLSLQESLFKFCHHFSNHCYEDREWFTSTLNHILTDWIWWRVQMFKKFGQRLTKLDAFSVQDCGLTGDAVRDQYKNCILSLKI
jgi:hypothetical protein